MEFSSADEGPRTETSCSMLYNCYWQANKLYISQISHSNEPIPDVITIFIIYIQDGDSPLMVAVREGKTGVVKELVKGGADLNLQSKVCQ